MKNPAPRLAGLPAQTLERQVSLFRDGSRQNITMHAMAMGIGGEPLQKLANDFSAQPVQPATPVQRGEQVVYTGPAAKLVYQGDWSHTLAGQQADYLKSQLPAWQQGQRSGDPDNTMGDIAGKLSGVKIVALSSYLADL